ncbi:hypothetical protein SDC9_178397 [bioreactor metagenome]|uniref:Uncharacterized protein n=1 Tax=bioreactor metagenome TaxID=1076179 RepID=A0A645GXE1_9ZZZZ
MDQRCANAHTDKLVHAKFFSCGVPNKHREKVENRIADGVDDNVSAGCDADQPQCAKEDAQAF